MMLKGKKVYLKKGLSNKEYSNLLSWFRDIEIMKYVNFVKKTLKFNTIKQVKLFFKDSKNHLLFGIFTYNNKLIGYAEIFDIIKKSGEFGIIIGEKDYWGKGIGTEVTKLMIDYSFNKLGLKRIYLTTSEYNKNAIKLCRKNGFKITKKIPNDREIFHNNKWIESATVCMELKKEFTTKN